MGEVGLPWRDENLDDILDIEVGLEDESKNFLGNELARKQYDNMWEVRARWEVYKHVPPEDYVDPAKDVIDRLHDYGLERHHSVLSVGCGSADSLVDLRLIYDHVGSLYGVDISPISFFASQTLLNQEGAEPITFLLGDMMNLNSLRLVSSDPKSTDYPEADFKKGPPDFVIEDESIDTVMCDFALYHADDVDDALTQMLAKLKVGGLFELSTSGPYNKNTQRTEENMLARFFSQQNGPTTPPPRFNAPFNSGNAASFFGRHPEIQLLGMISQETQAVVDQSKNGSQVRAAHLDSHRSMYKAYSPIPSPGLFNRGIEEVVANSIDQAVKRSGAYYIPVQRYWWFFRKVEHTR